MIGDYLYELTPRDMQRSWLDPLAFKVLNSVVAINVNNTYVVPTAQALILYSANVASFAGATQTVTSQDLYISAEGDAALVRIVGQTAAESSSAGPTPILNLNWSGYIVVPQLWTIRATSIFSGSVNANQSEMSLIGMLIPAGNFQRV